MSRLDKISDILMKLYEYHNGNIAQVAKEVETSGQNVHNWFKKRNMLGTGLQLKKADKELINSNTLTRNQLAEKLDINLGTLKKYQETKLTHGNLKYTDTLIKETLYLTNGNILQASKLLGMHQPCLFRLLKNRGIVAKDYKND